MVKRLAIVPARGGSKRIKNKNIKNFCGKPMIHHIIDVAIKSNLFDKIHISTECESIKRTVELKKLKIDFMRPKSLADDHTPLMPVLKYVVNKYNSFDLIYDEIWLLMACAPLIDANDLIEASKYFSQKINHKKNLLAIAEYPVPIEWSFTMSNNGFLEPRFPGKFKKRSQDLTRNYFDTGTFAIFPRLNIMNCNESGNDYGFIGFKLPKEKSIDIDTEEDWKMAEGLFNYLKK